MEFPDPVPTKNMWIYVIWRARSHESGKRVRVKNQMCSSKKLIIALPASQPAVGTLPASQLIIGCLNITSQLLEPFIHMWSLGAGSSWIFGAKFCIEVSNYTRISVQPAFRTSVWPSEQQLARNQLATVILQPLGVSISSALAVQNLWIQANCVCNPWSDRSGWLQCWSRGATGMLEVTAQWRHFKCAVICNLDSHCTYLREDHDHPLPAGPWL